MSSLHPRLVSTRLVLLGLALAGTLLFSGCYSSIGPTLGYALDDPSKGVTVGWEAGNTVPLMNANVGQVYVHNPTAALEGKDPQERIDFVSLEPWYFASSAASAGGASIGLTRSTHEAGTDALLGAWIAPPTYYDANARKFIPAHKASVDNHAFYTLNLGIRTLGSTTEIYLAPKIGFSGFTQ